MTHDDLSTYGKFKSRVPFAYIQSVLSSFILNFKLKVQRVVLEISNEVPNSACLVCESRAQHTTAQLTLPSSTSVPTPLGLSLFKPTPGVPRDSSMPTAHSYKPVETTMDFPR
jgi:hypothetical protein